MSKIIKLPSQIGEPFWEIAEEYPLQGEWTEEDYLNWGASKLVEFSDGYVEVLPMPSQSHQFIVLFLYNLLGNFIKGADLGFLLVAPMKVRVRPRNYREPDLVFILKENDSHRHELYWDGADLVMEVVSPDNPRRDKEQKRIEYAQAGIAEYWIVDPEDETITVLTLEGAEDDAYVVHGVFGRGQNAPSVLLEGFEANVSAVFDAPQ